MKNPCLFTTEDEMKQIIDNLKKYPWYRKSFDRIKAKVDEMLNRGAFVPNHGGYVFYDCCKRDNASLKFDPYTNYSMYCPKCGMRYSDYPHQRAWAVRYHSWLSQMGMLVGIVYQVEKNPVYAEFLHRILMDYAEVYPGFENSDNELGPTLMAQSTYMESVFIMNFAGAYDMVATDSVFSEADKAAIKKNFFRVSADAILDYDEKANNRQAFNNAGLIAVGYVLEDEGLVDYALNGPNGFVSHMKNSVLCDGLWYEGDNYHFATVPSLVNIAEMALRNGRDLYHDAFGGHTIQDLFMAPLMSLQPD